MQSLIAASTVQSIRTDVTTCMRRFMKTRNRTACTARLNDMACGIVPAQTRINVKASMSKYSRTNRTHFLHQVEMQRFCQHFQPGRMQWSSSPTGRVRRGVAPRLAHPSACQGLTTLPMAAGKVGRKQPLQTWRERTTGRRGKTSADLSQNGRHLLSLPPSLRVCNKQLLDTQSSQTR